MKIGAMFAVCGVLAVALTAMLTGCQTGATAQKGQNPTATTAAAETAVPSTEIIRDYQADQATADAKYKDKTIVISGNVTNINDVFGVKALLLRDSESETGLQCYLADATEAERVQVGQSVTVRGKIAGGELGPFMVADNCDLL